MSRYDADLIARDAAEDDRLFEQERQDRFDEFAPPYPGRARGEGARVTERAGTPFPARKAGDAPERTAVSSDDASSGSAASAHGTTPRPIPSEDAA